MKNLTFLKPYGVGLALLSMVCMLAPPITVQAQTVEQLLARAMNAEPVYAAVTADDTDIAITVKYIGPLASGLVAVAAGGDITFTDGAEGSEAATSTFECPVSGALGGVIDVSDAACNTLGEVVDIINASANWRAVIRDGLRTDSSNDTLVTLSVIAATAVGGRNLVRDTDVAFQITKTLQPPGTIDMRNFLNQAAGDLRANPFAGTRTEVCYANATSTYTSGTSFFQVWAVTVNNRANNTTNAGTEVATQLWNEAGGATTANKEFDDFKTFCIAGGRDQKLLVRVVNSAVMNTASLYAYGKRYSLVP